jgi:hypothetical protein
VAERLRADDLEGEVLELAAARRRIGIVGVDADIGGNVVDLGGAGEQVRRGLEVEAGVGLDQRGELQVASGVRGTPRLAPRRTSPGEFGLDETIVDIRPLGASARGNGRHAPAYPLPGHRADRDRRNA